MLHLDIGMDTNTGLAWGLDCRHHRFNVTTHATLFHHMRQSRHNYILLPLLKHGPDSQSRSTAVSVSFM